jgi:uncharacterized protein (DUF433 family)
MSTDNSYSILSSMIETSRSIVDNVIELLAKDSTGEEIQCDYDCSKQ